MSATDKPRYFPATTIPPALLREVQQHCQGGYLYIPCRQAITLVDRILRWAARDYAPKRIADMERCSVSYVYRVLAAHQDLPVERAVEASSDDEQTVREQEQTEKKRTRRIQQLKRHARALRGEGRAEAMQGNQHAKRHGVYSQRFTTEEHASMAELRPHLLDSYTDDETEILLRTLIQWQRAMLIEHIDAVERLGRRLRRLLRPELATPRRRRQEADTTESPLDWLVEFQAMRQRKEDAGGTGV
ncbi:MAG: hypothetical protein ACYC7E_02550 [Armatimonadota bacterium]